MTLLSRLQNALNKLDGRYSNIYEEEGNSHKDHYKCACGAIVSFEEWCDEERMCSACYCDMVQDQQMKWGEKNVES